MMGTATATQGDGKPVDCELSTSIRNGTSMLRCPHADGDTMTSAYEQYRARRLADPEFRSRYERHRREIDAVDRIVAAIDARRVELGLTKADLARLVGRKPESVRRLLSGNLVNPTVTTVSEMAIVLGLEVVTRPTIAAGELGPKVQKEARRLAVDAR